MLSSVQSTLTAEPCRYSLPSTWVLSFAAPSWRCDGMIPLRWDRMDGELYRVESNSSPGRSEERTRKERRKRKERPSRINTPPSPSQSIIT